MSDVHGTSGTTGINNAGQSTPAAQGQQSGNQNVNQHVDNTMFTQEQVNSIVSGRVGALNAKIAELNGLLETSQADASKFKAELDQYKQKADLAKAGIPESIADYAIFEISKLDGNGKTFAENAVEYAKANESFIKAIQSKQDNNGMQNGTQQQGQLGMQNHLLQQLVGQLGNNTNGAGNKSIQQNNDLSGLDMDKLLAEHGIKKRK